MVTGASGDIGAAIARVLALGGAKVILHYRSSKKRVTALASEPVFQTNGTTIVRADLTQEHDVKQMFETLAEEGTVHDIDCNAGCLKEQQVSLAKCLYSSGRQRLSAT